MDLGKNLFTKSMKILALPCPVEAGWGGRGRAICLARRCFGAGTRACARTGRTGVTLWRQQTRLACAHDPPHMSDQLQGTDELLNLHFIKKTPKSLKIIPNVEMIILANIFLQNFG